MRISIAILLTFLAGCSESPSGEVLTDYRCTVEQHDKALYEATTAKENSEDGGFHHYYTRAIIRNCTKYVDTVEKSQ